LNIRLKSFWSGFIKIGTAFNHNRLEGENSKTGEILPQEDFIKFYKSLNSRDKVHNSVQKQIIEEFVSSFWSGFIKIGIAFFNISFEIKSADAFYHYELI
jgi:hypothetical protein